MSRRGRQFGIGVVGCGRISQARHLPILKRMTGVRIAAVAERDPDTLCRVAEHYNVSGRYQDFGELPADRAVEAVIVATPPRCHFPQAREVLSNGRHLYVDSPLGISEEECQQLVDLAADSGCVSAVGLNLRHHSLVQRARSYIESGLLGSIQAISSTFTTPSRGARGDAFPAWRQPETVDGSVFGESSIQRFDIWRVLTASEFTDISVQCGTVGGPVSVVAKMQKPGAVDGGAIVAAGVFSEYAVDVNEIRVVGPKGTIALSLYRYDGFSYCPVLDTPGSVRQRLRDLTETVRSLRQGLTNFRHAGEFGLTFQRQLEAFVDACLGGAPPLVSMADGKAATVAALTAFRSMETGKNVKIAQNRGSS